jgi:hypothetical protein
MTIPENTKRKNDSNHNRRRNQIAQAMLLIVGIFCVIWLRNLQAKNDLPTARLIYHSRQGYVGLIAINLQTGEKTELEGNDYYNNKVSPDGEWSASWNDLNLCCDSILSVNPRLENRYQSDKQLGVYYGTSHSLSWMPDSRRIAFSAQPQRDDYYSNRGQDEGIPALEEEIYLQNIYTLEKTRLTENAFTDRYPTISPDGKLIAFTSKADGVERLYLMEIATRNTRLLTPNQDAYKPAWAPDGRWLAFISNCESGPSDYNSCGDLWLIRIDGTNVQSVAMGSGHSDILWLP